MTYKRLKPVRRKQEILVAATDLAVTKGYNRITHREVAMLAGISRSLICAYFPSIRNLRAAVMRHAIKESIPAIVAQGIVMRDPAVLSASNEVKQAAADWVFNDGLHHQREVCDD